MRLTAAELAEIRRAFRQRIATAPPPKRARAGTRKPAPQRRQRTFALARWPDYDDDVILTLGEVAELFAVSRRTVRRWADAGLLPSFRTLGGHRRFRWGEIRRVIA
jgi:excisionase family DNA binding protein